MTHRPPCSLKINTITSAFLMIFRNVHGFDPFFGALSLTSEFTFDCIWPEIPENVFMRCMRMLPKMDEGGRMMLEKGESKKLRLIRGSDHRKAVDEARSDSPCLPEVGLVECLVVFCDL